MRHDENITPISRSSRFIRQWSLEFLRLTTVAVVGDTDNEGALAQTPMETSRSLVVVPPLGEDAENATLAVDRCGS